MMPLIVASTYGGFGRFRGYVDDVRMAATIEYTGPFTPLLLTNPPLQADGSTVALFHYDAFFGTSIAQDGSAEHNSAMLDATGVWFEQRCF
jgi:hypothetical protein